MHHNKETANQNTAYNTATKLNTEFMNNIFKVKENKR